MSIPAAPSAPQTSNAALGGGVAVITLAKIWFVFAGYALYFGLTRLLGPERFGAYAVVLSIVSVANNVLVAAGLQTVSRFVARDPDRASAVLRRSMFALGVVGGAIFVAVQAGAPAIASLLRDASLVLPLRVASLIVLAYCLYAANVGFLNGRRRFKHQAGLDMLFSTLKLTLVLGAVAAGLGVTGAVGGFALAAFLVLGVSAILVRAALRPDAETLSHREMLQFGGWLLGLTLVINLSLSADLWIVKRMSDPSGANVQAGLYRAGLTLSQLLYQLLIPLSLVLFPSLSRLGASADAHAARALMRSALRYLSLTVLPAAAVLGVTGTALIALLYGAPYREGGAWLAVLAPAYALLSAAYLLATALSGAGHPARGVAIVSTALVVQVVAGAALFPRFGPLGAAAGDLIGNAAGLALGLVLVRRRFGAVLPWPTLARASVLAAALAGVALAWRAEGFALLVQFIVLGALALAFLLRTREIAGIRSLVPARARKVSR